MVVRYLRLKKRAIVSIVKILAIHRISVDGLEKVYRGICYYGITRAIARLVAAREMRKTKLNKSGMVANLFPFIVIEAMRYNKPVDGY